MGNAAFMDFSAEIFRKRFIIDYMKTDIKDRTDIARLIDSFYEKVKKDKTIGFIFNDIAKVDWDHHLPIMYDFWEGIIFQTGSYEGNPMRVHISLNQRIPLRAEHFARWKMLFLETVNELFEGEKAELARQRAVSIATMMEIKTNAENR
jgi:hemoglobin